MNKYNQLYKDKHYDILRDKYKFYKIDDTHWYRKYMFNYYYFVYMNSSIGSNYGTLKLTITNYKTITSEYLFYDDDELNNMLIRLFPAECRFEKLNNIL